MERLDQAAGRSRRCRPRGRRFRRSTRRCECSCLLSPVAAVLTQPIFSGRVTRPSAASRKPFPRDRSIAASEPHHPHSHLAIARAGDGARRRRARRGPRRSARASTAAALSSSVTRRLTPGIGTMSSPWASSQASATWARLTPCRSATALDRSRRSSDWRRNSPPNSADRCGASRWSGRSARLRDLAGEEAAAERAVGHEADAELAADRQDVVLDVALPQRIFGLQRGDRMDGGGAAQRLGRRLRRGRCGGPFPRWTSSAMPPTVSSIGIVGIDPVLVEEVDRRRCRAAAASLRRRGGHFPGCRRCR